MSLNGQKGKTSIMLLSLTSKHSMKHDKCLDPESQTPIISSNNISIASHISLMATSTPLLSLYLSIFSIAFFISHSEAQTSPPLVKGLTYSFYKKDCPKLESIVKKHLKQAIKNDPGLAAGLLRLHFHDCFVQGCDASVLLDGSASGPSEQAAPPNLSLRQAAFKAINDLRAAIDEACGQIVSCSDVLALAARDSVQLVGGPKYEVPLGRRDGLNFATRNTTLLSLPAPTSNVTTLLSIFKAIKLGTTDLVALSGGHTIGVGHCTSFTNRLYPSQDTTMDRTFANSLKRTCPASDTDNTTVLDILSPNRFDNKYYVDLVNRQGLFTSDQDLYVDSRTKAIVRRFAVNQTLFFERFKRSIVKMGQLGVVTGGAGEVRRNCSVRNVDRENVWSIVEELEKDGALAF